MAGAVGETGYGARRIVCRPLRNGRGYAGSAEGYGHVADAHAKAERSHGVVASAWGDDAAAVNVFASDGCIGSDRSLVARPQHGRQHDGIGVGPGGFGAFRRFERLGDEIASVFVRHGVVVHGAGSIGAVGEQRIEMRVFALRDRAISGDAPAQPIMRQTYRGDFPRVFGFVLRDPCHLGQGIGGDGGGAHGLDPT